MKRDPRRDPLPEDLLERCGLAYRVELVDLFRVDYVIPSMGLYFMSLRQWRRMMKHATVLPSAASATK